MNAIEKIEKIENETLERYRNSISRGAYINDLAKIKQIVEESGPSDTDFVLITRLCEVYYPTQRGFISGPELELIQNYLEFDRRNILQLRNLRNAVVCFMSQIDDKDFDRISAITHAIDTELLNRGAEI